MPVVTAKEMEREARAVAKGIAALVIAGMDPKASIAEKITALTSMGYGLFGDIGAGIDNEANRVRFGLEVGAKTMDILVSKLMPLTEPNDEPA